MINSDMFLTMAAKELENTNLFPFPFSLHLIFCIIALVFFIYRFVTDKKPFQLIMALAVPFSITIHISDSHTWFYIVGLIELILVIAAFVTSIIFRDKNKSAENSDKTESGDSEVAE